MSEKRTTTERVFTFTVRLSVDLPARVPELQFGHALADLLGKVLQALWGDWMIVPDGKMRAERVSITTKSYWRAD